MNVIQLIIVIILMFVLFYGLAFIVNMLLKTTNLPIYLYVIVLILWVYFHRDPGTLWENLREYGWGDIIPMIAGLIGAVMGGRTIKLLRDKGYKMF